MFGLQDVGWSSSSLSFPGRAEEFVHFFQGPEKSYEGAAQVNWAGSSLLKIAIVKLAGDRDYGGAHGAIFLRALRPRDALVVIDP
jgi:hypothetical protein